MSPGNVNNASQWHGGVMWRNNKQIGGESVA